MAICHFTVRGGGSPDLVQRVLNLFAQQDVAYEFATIVREGGCYLIVVEHRTLGLDRAALIVEKMRSMVLVHRAELTITDAA